MKKHNFKFENLGATGFNVIIHFTSCAPLIKVKTHIKTWYGICYVFLALATRGPTFFMLKWHWVKWSVKGVFAYFVTCSTIPSNHSNRNTACFTTPTFISPEKIFQTVKKRRSSMRNFREMWTDLQENVVWRRPFYFHAKSCELTCHAEEEENARAKQSRVSRIQRLLSDFPLPHSMKSDIQKGRCTTVIHKKAKKNNFIVSQNRAFMRGFLCGQQLLFCKASKHLILNTIIHFPLRLICTYIHTNIATTSD